MTLRAMVLAASLPTPLVAVHRKRPASSLATSDSVRIIPFLAMVTRRSPGSSWTDPPPPPPLPPATEEDESPESLTQLTTGDGFPLALQAMVTEAPRCTTRRPFGGWVITLGGTANGN